MSLSFKHKDNVARWKAGLEYVNESMPHSQISRHNPSPLDLQHPQEQCAARRACRVQRETLAEPSL